MNEQMVLQLARDMLAVSATLVGPLLIVGVTVGLVMSVLQTVTSLQEQTLTIVPKMAAVAGAIVLLLPWLLQVLCAYTVGLLRNLASYGS